MNKKIKTLIILIITFILACAGVVITKAYDKPLSQKSFNNGWTYIDVSVATTNGKYGSYRHITVGDGTIDNFNIWLSDFARDHHWSTNTLAYSGSGTPTDPHQSAQTVLPGYQATFTSSGATFKVDDSRVNSMSYGIYNGDVYPTGAGGWVRQAGRNYTLKVSCPTGYKYSSSSNLGNDRAAVAYISADRNSTVNGVKWDLWSWHSYADPASIFNNHDTATTGVDLCIDLQRLSNDEPDQTANIDIRYDAITYYVDYNGNGNSGGSTASSTHTYDAWGSLTPNGFTKTGYTFSGWNTNADGSGVSMGDGINIINQRNTDGARMTLYAQWTPNVYQQTINHYKWDLSTNNWSTTAFATTYENATYGTVFKPSYTTTPTGHYNHSRTWENGWPVSGAGTFNCYYYPNTYNQTTNHYKFIGSTSTWSTTPFSITTEQALYGSTYIPKYTTVIGYKNYSIDGSKVVSGNHSYTAKYYPIEYQISYNSTDATEGTMTNSNHMYDVSKNLNLNGFKKKVKVTLDPNSGTCDTEYLEAYASFEGWGTGGAKVYGDGESVVNLTTVDGSVVPLWAIFVNATFDLPVPVKEGWTFNGWSVASTDITGTKGAYNTKENITLYATWSKNISLTFNMNMGSYKGDASDKVLSGTIYNNETQYEFKINGTKQAAVPNISTEQMGTFEAYGLLTPNTSTEDWSNDICKVENGIKYRFLGWNTDKDATEPLEELDITNNFHRAYSVKVTDSTVVYAIYEPILQMKLINSRILGRTDETDWKTEGEYEQASYLVLSPGEMGNLQILLSGRNNATVNVEFDSDITDMSSSALPDSVRDNLNVDSLNKQFNNAEGNTSEQYYLPMYLGTEKFTQEVGYINKKDSYKVYVTAYQKRHNFYGDKDELVKIVMQIKIPEAVSDPVDNSEDVKNTLSEIKTRIRTN